MRIGGTDDDDDDDDDDDWPAAAAARICSGDSPRDSSDDEGALMVMTSAQRMSSFSDSRPSSVRTSSKIDLPLPALHAKPYIIVTSGLYVGFAWSNLITSAPNRARTDETVGPAITLQASKTLSPFSHPLLEGLASGSGGSDGDGGAEDEDDDGESEEEGDSTDSTAGTLTSAASSAHNDGDDGGGDDGAAV